jgi:hypothetical protein
MWATRPSIWLILSSVADLLIRSDVLNIEDVGTYFSLLEQLLDRLGYLE